MVFVKVTVSRTSLVIKNGNLTFKLTNTSINERFTVSDAGFVDQVTGRQIIGCVYYQIVFSDDKSVFRSQPLSVGYNSIEVTIRRVFCSLTVR